MPDCFCNLLEIYTANPDEFLGYTAAEGFAGGILLGAPTGAALGGLAALLKISRTFTINGNKDQWGEFQIFAEKVLKNKQSS